MVGEKVKTTIDKFSGLWPGGYFQGDPLGKNSPNGYQSQGVDKIVYRGKKMSVLHATYLECIKPYITEKTKSLEIGCGKGGWTKCLLGSKEVVCLEVLSEEETRFRDYIGHPENVKYITIKDFSCSMLRDVYFDYMFSFGCLCHLLFEEIEMYARNLFDKMNYGANCFWMVADEQNYIRATKGPSPNQKNLWCEASKEEISDMLDEEGYTVITEDVGTIPRDAIIHFMK